MNSQCESGFMCLNYPQQNIISVKSMAKLVLFNIKKKAISIKSIYVNYILNSQVQIQLDLCDMFEAVLIGKTMIFIFQEKATKWYENGREIDGLTTNGILIMHPRGSFVGGEAKCRFWLEASVGGGVFSLRESRSAQQKGFHIV